MMMAKIQKWPAARIVLRLLSVPILIKILGVGVVVAAAFGGTTLMLFDHVASDILFKMIEKHTLVTVNHLAESLERPIAIGDVLTVNQKLMNAMKMEPDIRYIIVRDSQGAVVAHTFNKAVPDDLLKLPSVSSKAEDTIQILGSEKGRIFNFHAPILEGRGGMLQLGVSDAVLLFQRKMLMRTTFGVLALSGALGSAMAFVLAYLITRPIHELKNATIRICQGNYSARIIGLPGDEIGELAEMFNYMTDSLEKSRYQIQQKEIARVSLLRQLVNVQEEERKHLARELHDQMGQSLSRVLLSFQCVRRNCGCSDGQCVELEHLMGDLIDKTRQMAWNVRPAVLDDYGLSSALERYLAETSKQIGFPISFECNLSQNSKRLPNEVEVTLYRITQEAISNVILHAHATSASVVLLSNVSTVTLVVGDNGCGFEIPNIMELDKKSLGLLGMRERASLLMGELEIESELEKGTEVLVSIPVENNQ